MVCHKIIIFIAIAVHTRSQDAKTVDDVVVHYKDEKFSLNTLALRLNKTVRYPFLRFCARDASFSCKRRCDVQDRNSWKKCYCDNECEHYGDCCFDYYLRCKHNKSIKAQISKSCVETKKPNLDKRGYAMVSKCSRMGTNKEIVKACEEDKPSDLLRTLPVFSSGTKLTYKNAFCARCNNVTNFVNWKFKGDCTGRDPSLFVNKSVLQLAEAVRGFCNWQYLPIQRQHEEYCITKVKNCENVNVTEAFAWNEAKTLCRSYSYPTCGGVGGYSRNPHCHLCQTQNNVDTVISCICDSGDKIPSLSFLFDFSSKPQYTRTYTGEVVSKVIQLTCEANQVYNIFTGKCETIHLQLQTEHFQNPNTTGCKTRIALNESDFRSLPNGSIYITSQGKLYGSSDFYIIGNTTILCTNFTRNYTKNLTKLILRNIDSQDASILALITYIGGGLSLLGLLILLAVYSWFSELRNLPGKIVMSLSGALLIYQVCFFLTGQTERRGVCSAVAIALHYFLLVSFTWMSIMAFDVARTFSSKNAGAGSRSSSSHRRMFYKYCGCGWGAPLVVVGVCVALDRTMSDSIGYGSGEYCWIAQRRALILAFIVPVAVTLCFNLVALTMTLLAIRNTHKITQHVTNRGSQRQLVFLTLKLFVILGLTWSLGFAVAFKETAFLRYPFTILNSLQGLLICLAFIVNKRIAGLMKTRRVETASSTAASSRAMRTSKCDDSKSTISTRV